MEGLAKLQASRKAFRSHLTRIYNKMEEIDFTQPATEEITSQVTSYIDQLKRKAESIRQLDSRISAEIRESEDLEREVYEAEEVQDLIIEKSTRLKRYLEVQQKLGTPHIRETASADASSLPPVTVTTPSTIVTTPSTTVTAPSTTVTTPSPTVTVPSATVTAPTMSISTASRLPKLSLPTFSGSPLLWQSFWDSFEAAVHNNPSLTGVEKFNYLRAQLEGEAARTVGGFPLTNANYEQSISLLKTRFGKQQRIINAHMQALLDLQAPTNTAVSLRELLDTLENHIRGLESLGKQKESFGDFLIPVVFGKLPAVIRKNLTRDHSSEQWNIDELLSAIGKEITVLESGLEKHGDQSRSTITGSFHTGIHQRPSHSQFQEKLVSSKPKCVYCKGPHVPMQCRVVTDLNARFDVVKGEQLCFNCLGHHKATHCNSKNRCKKCHNKHHTSLCRMENTPSMIPPNPTSHVTPNQSSQGNAQQPSQSFVPTTSASTNLTTTHTLFNNSEHNSMCLLKTAVAIVKVNNNKVIANILFDEGAQRSFITQTLADQLRSTSYGKETLCISSFGGETTSKSQIDIVRVVLETILGDVNISALVVPTIAAPLHNFVNSDVRKLPHLQGLKLAHPVGTPEKFDISLLIGADHYWQVVGNHIVRGKGPTAMQSKLGYLLSGPLSQQIQSTNTSVFHIQTLDLSNIADCPELPIDAGSVQPMTTPELFMDTYQRDCISRDKDGSYIARFPWKPDHPTLTPNLTVCERQTRALAKKLGRQPELLQLYGNIINEQQRRNFIEPVSPSDTQNNRGVHYIPHHPVRKDSPTTPVRIVYNCSCRQSRNHASLNDCLMVGNPPLIDISNILLRFRLHRFALSTDIEKAFLHVKLAECDRDFTRFLWLSDHSDPESKFVTYRFKVVLFGSTSSPFMLHATLDYHLKLHSSSVSMDMKNNLYVDNIISGCCSEEAIFQYYKEATSIMSEASFHLRSWASNSQKLQTIAKADGVLDSNTTVNLLGLKWNTCTDTIAIASRQLKPKGDTPVTKRSILQGTSKLYDPLGWLTPITIRARILMQELWKKQVTWDDPLDHDFQSRWQQVTTDLEEATKIVLTCKYFPLSSDKPICLHVFADASTKAYGAVAYLQSAGNVAFVMAKSRVSPLKNLTLPRLELKAAVTAAHLATSIVSALQVHMPSIQVRLWSDSQIVLHWISSTKQLKQFVANRVQEILKLFPTTIWSYCHTTDNAADLLTRGITPSQLASSQLWFQGPSWLTSESNWPTWSPTSVHHIQISNEELLTSEAVPAVDSMHGVHKIIDITRHSSLTKLHRVTAYVQRFIANLQNPLQKKIGPLTVQEIDKAQKLWLRCTQEQVFSNAIANLKSKSSSRLPLVRQLHLQLNDEGIIFCGGRIHNAPVSNLTKFPYLLPRRHRLTDLIVRDVHEKNFHAGTNSTVTYLRQRYWIPAARQCVRNILKHCVVCNKLCGSHFRAPDPPPLPKHRVQAMDPFTVTGVDFTGALYVRAPERENKVYVCLFTCANTRAVHLEVVNDLSEETFLQAFRRFSSRKSLPRLMISDNASTFMSAAEELKELLKSDTLHADLSKQGVEWRFIPCRAPWYGGYWERLIGLTKRALKKTIGRAYVTLSALQTLIVEIEAHLNNRPLTYVSSDLNEPEPLTPSHLLYARMINPLPHPIIEHDDITDEDYSTGHTLHCKLSKRAKMQAMLLQHFWKRWKNEYLTSLRETHTANGTKKETIKVGDVVIVHDDTPRLNWRLAIIKELQRGQDGFVRSASIQTTNGITSRPITKLYPLEINVESATTKQPPGDNSHDTTQDSHSSDTEELPTSTRPHRIAANKARSLMTEWSKILRAPEDVMD